ncbi:hypothetical protein NE237_012523 [Protea cynaroides]|uniref:Uncharacterized protein n=1 Tax=Protea cynaroides TaxID=273540 RepID=A0A9Q0GY81_9MAGN|nr:hypothetical protein NE237_012523 [Protea cynaroides]
MYLIKFCGSCTTRATVARYGNEGTDVMELIRKSSFCRIRAFYTIAAGGHVSTETLDEFPERLCLSFLKILMSFLCRSVLASLIATYFFFYFGFSPLRCTSVLEVKSAITTFLESDILA